MSAKEILKNLVSFNTVNDKENIVIINYIEKILKDKGFRLESKSKCLIMSIKNEYKLGFLGHTDTVIGDSNWETNPYEMIEKNGKLCGLGVCDMKGGLAGILQAVTEIDWKSLKYGMKLYFTYDEEIGFNGIKEIVDKKEKFPNYMIIGEPSNNVVMNASKGLLEIKLTFIGVSSHSSMPNKGQNAIEKTIKFLNELEVFYNILKKDKNDNFEINYTTMNIGKISGGTSINIVPNYCEVLIDFRIIKNEHINLILDMINKLTLKYDATYEVINNIKSFINKNEKICSTNFITEASFIDTENKYILGVGPVNPHEANEYIMEESLEKLVTQYKDMIYKFCN
jgi:acetylornithine deacetylase